MKTTFATPGKWIGPTLAGLVIVILAALLIGAVRHYERHRAEGGRRLHTLPPLLQASLDSSPLDLMVDRQQKAVIGRPESYDQIARTADETGPLVRQSLEQSSIQQAASAMAAAMHQSPAEFKDFFAHKQEADILLESGGDADAISPAGAAGVAQWLISTGRGRGGLRIDPMRSAALTVEIESCASHIHWLRAKPPDYTAPSDAMPPESVLRQTASLPTASSTPTSPAPADGRAVQPSTPPSGPPPQTWTRDQLISLRQQQMQQFSQQRRSIDQRFDPRMAIEAQTRYLIWMWARYPSLDWVFEAYHGGEKGVERTLASYLGARWREAGTPAHAILGEDRMGNRVGDPVSYADIFFHTSPRMHTEAFAYLYGLRDDHRAYWFKLLMAEKAIAWYRRDPRSLHDQWMALRPGCPIEDAWYPETDKLLYADGQAVAAGRAAGELIPLSSESIPGVQVGSLPFLPETQSTLAAARPEVLGALSRVAVTYREESLHPSPLVIVALTQPVDLVAAIRQQYPAPRPRGMLEPSASDPSSDTDMHTLGLAASIRKPTDPWEDRVLQYALSYWEDRERIHFNTETWGGIEAWRITPNPVYKQELSASRKNGA